MASTVRVLQVRFVQMGVEHLSVTVEAYPVLLIQLSNCQRRSVSSLYFWLRLFSRGDHLVEKFSGAIEIICVSLLEERQYLVCWWLMYFLMWERERQCQFDKSVSLFFLLNPFHCNSWGRRAFWFASAVWAVSQVKGVNFKHKYEIFLFFSIGYNFRKES